jgi:hypothetical protein
MKHLNNAASALRKSENVPYAQWIFDSSAKAADSSRLQLADNESTQKTLLQDQSTLRQKSWNVTREVTAFKRPVAEWL